MNKNYFIFENQDYDIPLYKNNPRLTKNNAIILLVGLLIAILIPYVLPNDFNSLIKAIIITVVTAVPVLYILKDNLAMILRVPTRFDLTTIILGFCFYFAFSILVSSTLSAFGVPSAVDKTGGATNAILIVTMIIEILGEEFLKFIAFVLTMKYCYKRMDRKNSILFAIIVSQVIFAIFNIPACGSLIHAFISIGLVSIILPIIYLSTKNITSTYITHLLIDILPTLFL